MSDEELIEKIADEISGISVGEGYYSQTVGIDAALEAAKAIAPLLNRVRAEAIREFARQASKRNIGTLRYRQQVLQYAESYADRIEQNSEGNEA